MLPNKESQETRPSRNAELARSCPILGYQTHEAPETHDALTAVFHLGEFLLRQFPFCPLLRINMTDAECQNSRAVHARLLLGVIAYFGDLLSAPRVLRAMLQCQELRDRQRHAAEVLRAHRPEHEGFLGFSRGFFQHPGAPPPSLQPRCRLSHPTGLGPGPGQYTLSGDFCPSATLHRKLSRPTGAHPNPVPERHFTNNSRQPPSTCSPSLYGDTVLQVSTRSL